MRVFYLIYENYDDGVIPFVEGLIGFTWLGRVVMLSFVGGSANGSPKMGIWPNSREHSSTIQRGGMGTASGAGSLRSVAGVAKLIRSISKPAGA